MREDVKLPKIIQESEISLKFHFPLAQGWDRERLLLASEYASQIGSAAVVILYVVARNN